MRKNLLPRLVLFLGLAILAVTARAGTLDGWGRYFGWGWSDGYHARPPAPYWQPAPFDNYYPQAYPTPARTEIQPIPEAAKRAPVMNGRLPALPSRQAQPHFVPLKR